MSLEAAVGRIAAGRYKVAGTTDRGYVHASAARPALDDHGARRSASEMRCRNFRRTPGAYFSSAWSVFKVLSASVPRQLYLSCGSSSGVAHNQPRCRVSRLVGWRLPRPPFPRADPILSRCRHFRVSGRLGLPTDSRAPKQLCSTCASSAGEHARPCTTSCGFDASEAIPFPGRDSVFSNRCGAISGRLRCRSLSRRPPGVGKASAQKIDDRPSPPRSRTNIERSRNSVKKI
jgi:hypothetical protein